MEARIIRKKIGSEWVNFESIVLNLAGKSYNGFKIVKEASTGESTLPSKAVKEVKSFS